MVKLEAASSLVLLCFCRGVSAWYDWLVNRGDKGPKYEGNSDPALFRNDMGVLDRNAILDRTSHVRNCSACSKVSSAGLHSSFLVFSSFCLIYRCIS